jgi:hypothetical protein
LVWWCARRQHNQQQRQPHDTPKTKTKQGVLAAFRSQRVAAVAFDLTPSGRLRIAVDCDNGVCLILWSRSLSSCKPLVRKTDFALQHTTTSKTTNPKQNQIKPTGLVKRYAVDALDADILHAAVDRDACPTVVVAEAGELNKCACSKKVFFRGGDA